MTGGQAKKLKPGDRVYNGTLLRGVIYLASKETVVIAWDHTTEHDILARSSQMWLFLSVVK